MRHSRLLGLCVLGVMMGSILVSCSAPSGIPVPEETPAVSDSTTNACEGVSISNPAAAYCSMLGYEPGTQDTSEGQLGICTFPDGTVCDAWQFLRGKCGEEFSWCALNGMEIQSVTESDGSSTQEYAVCVDATGTIVGKVVELSGLQALLESCTR